MTFSFRHNGLCLHYNIKRYTTLVRILYLMCLQTINTDE